MPINVPCALLLSLQLAAVPPPPMPVAAAAPAAEPNDLAAEAPQPEWVPEGGTAAHKANVDPHEENKKMRRAARTTIAGGAVAVLGLTAAIGGLVTMSMPKSSLDKLERENDGVLPADDPARQRAIVLARVSPAMLGAGAGLFLVGAVIAGVSGRRFKRMHEEKRTSTVAFAPMQWRRGGGLALQVRF